MTGTISLSSLCDESRGSPKVVRRSFALARTSLEGKTIPASGQGLGPSPAYRKPRRSASQDRHAQCDGTSSGSSAVERDSRPILRPMTSDPGHGKSVGEGEEAFGDARPDLLSDREGLADARDAVLSARSEVLVQVEHDRCRRDEELDRVLRAADERDHAAEVRVAAALARETATEARRQRATDDTVLDQAAQDMAAVDQEWAARDRDEAAADRDDLRRLSTARHDVRRAEMTPEDTVAGPQDSSAFGVPPRPRVASAA